MATKTKKEIELKGTTLRKAIEEYRWDVLEVEQTDRTTETYMRILNRITNHLEEELAFAIITSKTLKEYFSSDLFQKTPTGRQKAEISLKQDRRVLRMFLTWATEKGYFSSNPYPSK